jgi:hypothetical protein
MPQPADASAFPPHVPLASLLPPRSVDIVHLAGPAARAIGERGPAPAREQHPRHRQRGNGEQSNTQGTDNDLLVQVSRASFHAINNSTRCKGAAASALTPSRVERPRFL